MPSRLWWSCRRRSRGRGCCRRRRRRRRSRRRGCWGRGCWWISSRGRGWRRHINRPNCSTRRRWRTRITKYFWALGRWHYRNPNPRHHWNYCFPCPCSPFSCRSDVQRSSEKEGWHQWVSKGWYGPWEKRNITWQELNLYKQNWAVRSAP